MRFSLNLAGALPKVAETWKRDQQHLLDQNLMRTCRASRLNLAYVELLVDAIIEGL